MWVAAGAKYLPDPPQPAKVLRMLEDNGIAAPGVERRGREERRAARGGEGRGEKGGGREEGTNRTPKTKVMWQPRLIPALPHPYTRRPETLT